MKSAASLHKIGFELAAVTLLIGLTLLCGRSMGSETDVVDIPRSGKYDTDIPDIGAFEYYISPPVEIALSYVVNPPNVDYTLEWNHPASSDMTFRVFWGSSSGQYDNDSGNIGTSTHLAVSLPEKTQFYFAIKAYDRMHRPSGYSTEVSAQKKGNGSHHAPFCFVSTSFSDLAAHCHSGPHRAWPWVILLSPVALCFLLLMMRPGNRLD